MFKDTTQIDDLLNLNLGEFSNYFKDCKDFDLYSHMKSNIKNNDGICEIHDSLFTTYCISCRRSICEVCRDSYHTSHLFLDKKDLTNYDSIIADKIFKNLEDAVIETDIFK